MYYQQKGSESIILLAGGDKSNQARDIDEALMLAVVTKSSSEQVDCASRHFDLSSLLN